MTDRQTNIHDLHIYETSCRIKILKFLKNSIKVDDLPTNQPTDIHDLRTYATCRHIKIVLEWRHKTKKSLFSMFP